MAMYESRWNGAIWQNFSPLPILGREQGCLRINLPLSIARRTKYKRAIWASKQGPGKDLGVLRAAQIHEQRRRVMVSTISLISVVLGVSGAALADRLEAHKDFLEIGSGACFVCGLMLLGCSLPVIL